jgi:hypothetical protein
VLNLSLSEESAAIARTLLRKWMSPATTPDEMTEFIQNNVPRSERLGEEEEGQSVRRKPHGSTWSSAR